MIIIAAPTSCQKEYFSFKTIKATARVNTGLTVLIIAELLAPIFFTASAKRVKGKAVEKTAIIKHQKIASEFSRSSELGFVKAKSRAMYPKAKETTSVTRYWLFISLPLFPSKTR